MTAITNRFDPWGPISTVLYGTSDFDFVLDAINNTGIVVESHPLNKNENFSHKTRIRAFRQDVTKAYQALNLDERRRFAQIVAKSILERPNANELFSHISEHLHNIDWTISETGVLKTNDALISELFFPPNSEYDAYVTIREILSSAKRTITLVDAYMGSIFLATIKGISVPALDVRILTEEKHLKPDFLHELKLFKKQYQHCQIGVRATSSFHDRFIVIDEDSLYHVGASIKDAGKRAFMISRIEDQPNIDSLKRHIEREWEGGKDVG